ncbi:hypothetical protein JTE90_023667 [Oedothorax gibbosus]|uniref:Uncharacterized protein n=1 Tax=Oedothorax gibbosus TaxID=931172 RepID=A0AAV6U9A0_9ARAC|nr:hypothetical protein JTE90_023667 [Oedothorax gibbosus]
MGRGKKRKETSPSVIKTIQIVRNLFLQFFNFRKAVHFQIEKERNAFQYRFDVDPSSDVYPSVPQWVYCRVFTVFRFKTPKQWPDKGPVVNQKLFFLLYIPPDCVIMGKIVKVDLPLLCLWGRTALPINKEGDGNKHRGRPDLVSLP